MFRGSIPADVRSMLKEVVEEWQCSDIYVGCSGNFTVERVIATEFDRFVLHGNDVTLYSSSIGWFLANQEVPVSVSPAFVDTFGWLDEYLCSPAAVAATMMLATHLTMGLSTKGEVKHNDHYARMGEAYRAQWGGLHAETVERLENLPVSLASFHCGDVVEWIEQIPQDQGLVVYPPFYAGDYESMFSKLDLLFSWPKPEYPLLDEGRKQQFFSRVIDRSIWALGVCERLDGMGGYLHGVTQTTNRAVPLYLYSSVGPRRVSVPRQKIEPVFAPRLTSGMEIGDHMILSVLSEGQFCSLRSQYMNIRIRPGQASLPVAVLVDGYLIGVFAFTAAPHVGSGIDTSRAYLLSDFAVVPTDYPKLSKLVLYAALSRESKLLVERLLRRRVREVMTTAFSNRPVSMKYRGLFALHSRKENEDASDSAVGIAHDKQKFQLNYCAPIGRWSLDEGLKTWKKRYSKV